MRVLYVHVMAADADADADADARYICCGAAMRAGYTCMSLLLLLHPRRVSLVPLLFSGSHRSSDQTSAPSTAVTPWYTPNEQRSEHYDY